MRRVIWAAHWGVNGQNDESDIFRRSPVGARPHPPKLYIARARRVSSGVMIGRFQGKRRYLGALWITSWPGSPNRPDRWESRKLRLACFSTAFHRAASGHSPPFSLFLPSPSSLFPLPSSLFPSSLFPLPSPLPLPSPSSLGDLPLALQHSNLAGPRPSFAALSQHLFIPANELTRALARALPFGLGAAA